MKNELISDEELLNYLDRIVDTATMTKINQLLQTESEVARRLDELRVIHDFLANKNKLEQPSKSFTNKVMSGLHEKQSIFFLSPRNGLLLLAGILVASGLALTLLSAGTFDTLHTILNIQSLNVKTELVNIPNSLPFDMKPIIKIFLCLNLILALILLDRTVLRPIFQKRLDRLA